MKDLLRHSFSSLQFKQQSKEKSNEEVFIDSDGAFNWRKHLGTASTERRRFWIAVE